MRLKNSPLLIPMDNPSSHGSVEDNPIDLSAQIYLLNRAAHAESLAHTSVIAADRVPDAIYKVIQIAIQLCEKTKILCEMYVYLHIPQPKKSQGSMKNPRFIQETRRL